MKPPEIPDIRKYLPSPARIRSAIESIMTLRPSRPAQTPKAAAGEEVLDSMGPPIALDVQLVTLVAEDESLKLIAVAGNRVVLWAKIPLDQPAVRNGIVVDSRLLGAVIASTFRRLKLSSHSPVICAISGLYASSTLLDLPKASDSMLESLVYDETSRELGIQLDDRYLYWQTVESRHFGQTVFVLAVPREPVLAMVKALDHAGIRPQSMDLTPLALVRWANHLDAIVAGLEPTGLDLAIVVNGIPRFIKTVHFGEPIDDESVIRDRLSNELSEALDWYEGRHPEQPLDQIAPVCLAGSMATGIALAEFVRNRTGHPIGRPAPLLVYPKDFPASEYAVNIGLALKR